MSFRLFRRGLSEVHIAMYFRHHVKCLLCTSTLRCLSNRQNILCSDIFWRNIEIKTQKITKKYLKKKHKKY